MRRSHFTAATTLGAVVAVAASLTGCGSGRGAGPLSLAGDWAMLADPVDTTMSFSGFMPCMENGEQARVVDVQPVSVTGELAGFHAGITREEVRADADGVKTVGFIGLPGWPPETHGRIEIHRLPDAPPIARSCDEGPVEDGETNVDVAVAATPSDPSTGVIIEGLAVTYETGTSRYRTIVDVRLGLCGTSPSRDVCADGDEVEGP